MNDETWGLVFGKHIMKELLCVRKPGVSGMIAPPSLTQAEILP